MKTINLIYAPKTRAYKKGLRVEHSLTQQDQLRNYKIRLRNSRAAAIQDQLEQWAREKALAKKTRHHKTKVLTENEKKLIMIKNNVQCRKTIEMDKELQKDIVSNHWDIETNYIDIAYLFAHCTIKKYFLHHSDLQSARELYSQSVTAITNHCKGNDIINDTTTLCYDLFNTAYISLIQYTLPLNVDFKTTPLKWFFTYPLEIYRKPNGDVRVKTLLQTVCNDCRNHINSYSYNHGKVNTTSLYKSNREDNTMYINEVMDIEQSGINTSDIVMYNTMCDNLKDVIAQSKYKNKDTMNKVLALLLQGYKVSDISIELEVNRSNIYRAIDNIATLISMVIDKDIIRVRNGKGHTKYVYTSNAKATATTTNTKVDVNGILAQLKK